MQEQWESLIFLPTLEIYVYIKFLEKELPNFSFSHHFLPSNLLTIAVLVSKMVVKKNYLLMHYMTVREQWVENRNNKTITIYTS